MFIVDNKKYSVVYMIINILTLIMAVITIAYNVIFPRITLLGNSTVIINYKQKYKEPGFKAKILFKDLTDKVEVENNININKIGTYKVKYTVSFSGLKRTITRKVKVIDDSKPVITLKGNETTYVCPNTTYNDEGATAFDNYDKDLTSKIETRKEEDYVIYTVADSSNNKETVKRKLIYEDKESPNLTVDSVVYVVEGEAFTKKYSVQDNCDTNIEKNVKTEGSVNTNVIGKYTIKYIATDNSGNKSEATQTVYVTEKGGPGTIYLTFDDGPNSGTTNVILDILKEEGVKATFFVTNYGPDELIKREYNEGHTVAIHSASHEYSVVYSSKEAYWNDLKIVQDRIKRITGETSMIVRFPGGSSNTVSRKYNNGIMSYLTKDLVEKGYKYYDWNISSGDAGETTSPDGVYNNVVRNLRHDRINMVLMHDIKWYTRDALRRIIQYGKANGYSFQKITEGTKMITQRVNN